MRELILGERFSVSVFAYRTYRACILPSLRATCFPTIASEIVSSIFDEIEDASDCFCLALTSKRCWLIGQPRMEAVILEHAIMWAGDRIVCFGSYTERGDLPEGLLSAEEEEAIDNHPLGPEDEEDSYIARLDSFYGKILPSSRYEPGSLLRKLLDCDQIPLQDRDMLLSSIRICHPEPDVLRNLSKRQYVRRAALVKLRKTCPKNWEFNRVDLGHIVASRFCWSSDPSIATSYSGGLHRGVWAGDRFDIASADALEKKDENGLQIQWTDVTEEVLEEMQCIWSSEFGEGVFEVMVSVLNDSGCDNFSRRIGLTACYLPMLPCRERVMSVFVPPSSVLE